MGLYIVNLVNLLSLAMNYIALLCCVAIVISEVHGGYGGGLWGGGLYGPLGGWFGGFPFFGYGGYGGYGYGGKGGYGYGSYGGSRYKRSTDSYTDVQHSPAVHAVHSSDLTSPVHDTEHHVVPVHHAVYNTVPATRTVHVSGHFSPAVVYSYPKHHGGSYGNTYSNYGYTSTPSYGLSYGHSTPSFSDSAVVYGHESLYGHSTPSHSAVVHGH